MKEKNTKGIFIPEKVLHSKNLSMFAKILYGEIASICERDGFCKKTNIQLAELCGVQKCIISRWIKKFKDTKFLKVIYKGKHNYIRFIFLSTADKNTTKRTIQAYYTIVPRCKNSKEYIKHKNNAFEDIKIDNPQDIEDDSYFSFENMNKLFNEDGSKRKSQIKD